MNSFEKKQRLSIFLLVSIFLFISCSKKKIEDAEKLDFTQSVHLSFSSDVCFDVNAAYNTDEFEILSHVYEGLFRCFTDENGITKMEYAGCSSYSVTPDGLRYTFYLRRDCYWSDGINVMAQDYVYSYLRLMDQDNNFVYSILTQNISDIVVLNDYCFSIDLYNCDSSFLQKLCLICFYPIREDCSDVYNGPFVISEFCDSTIILSKNYIYRNRDAVHLEKIIFERKNNMFDLTSDFEKGSLDIIEVTDNEILKKWTSSYNKADYKVYDCDNVGLFYLLFDMSGEKKTCNSGLMCNEKIRLALSLSIDRDKLCNLFVDKFFLPAYSLVPYGLSFGEKKYRAQVDEPLKAFETQMQYDGFVRNLFEKGLKECEYVPSGEYIHLRVNCFRDDGLTSALFTWLDSVYREKLGVALDVVLYDNIVDYIHDCDSDGFDILIEGWYADYDDPLSMLELVYKYNGSDFMGNFNQPRYDILIRNALSCTDEMKRLAYYALAEDYLINKSVIAPLVFPQLKFCTQSYLKNVSFSSFGAPYELSRAYIVEH